MLKLLVGALLCMAPVLAQNPFGVFTFKCSTAMVCVDLVQCDQFGVIAKNAVSLTADEEAFRQPLVPCKKSDGNRGVCCRDPDYKDDWPSDYVDPGIKQVTCPPPLIKLPSGKCGNPPKPPPETSNQDECKPPLVKLPSGKCGVPEKKIPPPEKKKPPTKVVAIPTPKVVITTKTTTTTKPTRIIPPSLDILPPPEGDYESPGCPRRNRTAKPDKLYKPYDSSDFEAGAGEFPWQGAVFTSAGQFLCTCYNTYNSTCTTTASCVKDYKPSDLKVAVGIYDIVDPLSVFEHKKGDKNPQISSCKAIAFDPQYNSATGKYDIAVLHLSNLVRYNYYTKAICLDEYYAIPFFTYDDCVVTGWGDSDTYHYIDVELLSESDCKKAVPGFDPKAMSCAKPNHDVCKLVEFGGGFHCRETGKRNKKSSDVYLLKGTYSAVNSCSPGSQVITFSHIDFDWFKEALYNPLKYPLRG